MNRNGKEESIRQLFHELRCEDQRHAPQFGDLLTAARNRNEGSNIPTWSIKFAAAAVLCVLVLITIRLSTPVRPQEQQLVPDSASGPLAASDKTTDVVRNLSQPPKTQRHPSIRRQSRPRQFSSSLAIAMKALSSWQSPTAALLDTPQDRMLNTLPRLGESLRTIKPLSPDQFN
ncbi:MAG TPA: hypothetical protein VKN18_03960 [Blastocatellia bacterium]|nr:hypothetical protein [Blastocatellia bacterium]